MTGRFSQGPGRLRRAAAFVIAVSILPLPLSAAEKGTKPVAAQPLRTSIATHAAREVLVSSPKRADGTATKTRAQSSSPQSGGKSFFSSPAGIACLAVIGAGTGFALYSASHDRIHSVARSGQ